MTTPILFDEMAEKGMTLIGQKEKFSNDDIENAHQILSLYFSRYIDIGTQAAEDINVTDVMFRKMGYNFPKKVWDKLKDAPQDFSIKDYCAYTKHCDERLNTVVNFCFNIIKENELRISGTILPIISLCRREMGEVVDQLRNNVDTKKAAEKSFSQLVILKNQLIQITTNWDADKSHEQLLVLQDQLIQIIHFLTILGFLEEEATNKEEPKPFEKKPAKEEAATEESEQKATEQKATDAVEEEIEKAEKITVKAKQKEFDIVEVEKFIKKSWKREAVLDILKRFDSITKGEIYDKLRTLCPDLSFGNFQKSVSELVKKKIIGYKQESPSSAGIYSAKNYVGNVIQTQQFEELCSKR